MNTSQSILNILRCIPFHLYAFGLCCLLDPLLHVVTKSIEIKYNLNMSLTMINYNLNISQS